MIAITLQFKTVEAARKALLDIPQTDLIEAEPGPAPEVQPAPAKPAKAAKPAQETPPPPKAEAPKKVEEPAKAPTEAITYPVLQKAVFALAAKSRDAAGQVAAAFGVKTFKELPEDKWGEALEAVNAKLAELEAA